MLKGELFDCCCCCCCDDDDVGDDGGFDIVDVDVEAVVVVVIGRFLLWGDRL